MKNNKIKTLVISALMVVSALGPQRSHAALSLVAAPVLITTAVIGGLLTASGLTVGGISFLASTTTKTEVEAQCLGVSLTMGLFLTAVGITFLPADSNSVVLPELNEENSLSLGLTEAELQAYQSEKMDLDVLIQDLNEIARSAESPEMGTQRVAAEFENQKSRFSPHTLNALKKILQPINAVLVRNT